MSASGLPIRVEARVLSLHDEGGANRRLALEVPGWPGFEPGQFVMLEAGARGAARRSDPLLPRPMAVYRALEGGGIEILFKVHGRGTALLADLEPGQRLGIVGPLGRPFPDPPQGARALLVAGGTGIASVYSLAERAHERGAAPEVLLGARSAGDLMGESDFEKLGVPLVLATEDGSRGVRGLVTALLEEKVGSGAPGTVYACGPTPMMDAAARIAAAAGWPCWVSLENPMACGFGVCLGCAAPLREGGFALVCRDGPVMDASTLAWAGLA